MEILLEELYKTDLIVDKFHQRKIFLEDLSYQISGITHSGKTKLVKNYLLTLKKNSYLYIDCDDLRINNDDLNLHLHSFCVKNKILTVVLDNYNRSINLPMVPQLIVLSQEKYELDGLVPITLFPLDYEEFLAYEHKYDSSALNHFFLFGGFASMHTIKSDERVRFVQNILKSALTPLELEILIFSTKQMAQKVSPFSIYERLKQSIKTSKDTLYKSFDALNKKGYIHLLAKANHPKAIKKIYLCDISLKYALSVDKNFSKLFENMIFLELIKKNQEVYYDEGVDFYLPSGDEIILAMPFANERVLFKKIENIEAFIFSYQIKKIKVVTMSLESSMSHPLSQIEMIPFDIWALGD